MRKESCKKKFVYHWMQLLLALFIMAGFMNCTRSVRVQAAKVAAVGKTTSEQMAAYYDTLAKDTINVWEMTAFWRGYLDLPKTDVTKSLQAEYKIRYLALLDRKRFAGIIAATYNEFINLASYDSSAEVLASVNNLSEAAKGLLGHPLIPLQPASSPVESASVIDALVKELQTLAENRAILKENKNLVTLLEKIKNVFAVELPVYKSIADDKKRIYTEVAQSLVKGKAVDSTALVNRVLEAYELKWPMPTQPFQNQNLIDAIVEVIDARAASIAEISQDVGDKLSSALAQLLALHKTLVEGNPLTFQEMVKQNAIVQDLLDALKAKANIDIRKIIAVEEDK